MKNINIYISLITILLLFVRCEDEFLTETNPNSVTTDLFWQTEADFNKGLTSVYAALQFKSVNGNSMASLEVARTDVGRSAEWFQQHVAFNTFSWNDNTDYVRNSWAQTYIGIFRANQVLQNIEGISIDGFTDEEITLITAQARFLRGLYYFWITNAYNGAVIHTAVPVAGDDFKKPFENRATVIETIIKPDLAYAFENLPKIWEQPESLGRATWGAAAAALGKVHLFDRQWDEAAGYFKAIIDSGLYWLTSDIMDNFTTLSEFNSESIFEVNFSDVLKPGVHADVIDGSDAEATGRPMQFAPANAGGWRTTLPTYWIHELFLNDSINTNRAENVDRRYSTRAFASLAFQGQDGGYYLSDDVEVAGNFNHGESAYVKKFTNWYHAKGEDSQNNRSGINERIIRLADIYLMYAEAILVRDGDAAIEEAVDYIDFVRDRAAVLTIQHYRDNLAGQIPELYVRKDENGVHPLVPLNASNLLTHLQRVERPLELCFEGHGIRWYDLVRWGILGEVFEELNLVDYINESPFPIVSPIVPNFDGAVQNYSADKHYFPIPNIELNANSGIGIGG